MLDVRYHCVVNTSWTRARFGRSLVVGTIGLSDLARSPSRAAEPGVRITSGPPIDASGELAYAQREGFFQQRGLTVVEVPLPGGSSAPAVAGNAVDIGYLTVDAVAVAQEQGADFVLLAPAAMYAAPDSERVAALVVAVDSRLQRASDFAGAVIAAQALGTMAEYAPRAWLDRTGGDSNSVKFVEVPFPEMPVAVREKRVDAAWITEPFVSLSLRNGGRIVTYWTPVIAPQFLISGWYSRREWARSNPDLVSAFRDAMRLTAVWANAHHNESSGILSAAAHTDPSIIATMARARYALTLDPALIQPIVDLVAHYRRFPPFSAGRLIYGD